MIKKISIVIPAYNEEKRICYTLNRTIVYCEKEYGKDNYEIIVVNDCSTDNTVQKVLELKRKNIWLISNNVNRGKGASVKRGMLMAKFDNVLFMDADFATPIEMLSRFNVKGDILIGSRHVNGSLIPIKQPILRRFLGICFRYLVMFITGLKYKDTQCGFKLFKKHTIKDIFNNAEVDRFAFDVELLILADKFDYIIKEVPVTWYDKPGSSVNNYKDLINMLIDIIKVKWRFK